MVMKVECLLMLSRLFYSVLILEMTMSLLSCTAHAAPKAPIPAPAADAALSAAAGKQTAVFAGGCFWGTQTVFQRVKGVLKTTAGYAGVLVGPAGIGLIANIISLPVAFAMLAMLLGVVTLSARVVANSQGVART